MSARTCRPGCDRYVPPARAFCPACWRLVPKDLQRTVYRSWDEVGRCTATVESHHRILGLVAEGLAGRSWDEVRDELGRPQRTSRGERCEA